MNWLNKLSYENKYISGLHYFFELAISTLSATLQAGGLIDLDRERGANRNQSRGIQFIHAKRLTHHPNTRYTLLVMDSFNSPMVLSNILENLSTSWLLYVIVQVFAWFGKTSGRAWSSHGLYFGETVGRAKISLARPNKPWYFPESSKNLRDYMFIIPDRKMYFENKIISTWNFIHAWTRAHTSFPRLGDRTPSKEKFWREFCN